MNQKWKICMVGLGSIGKKHIGNLSKVLRERNIHYQIDALRNGHGVLPENIEKLISHTYYSVEELSMDYDIIFITNPTSKHYETIKSLSDRTKTMFIEKPLFQSVEYKTQELGLKKDGIYYVACPLRHKAIIQYVKQLVDRGEQIYSARAISSSYLPEWRTGVDYRQAYSARRDLGGGVTLDLIHEWDYLTYLFGIPEKVYNIRGHYSELELDSDDISIYIGTCKDKTVEVHLDYIGRKLERKLELYCREYRIDVDIINNRILYFGNEEKEVVFPTEDMYLNEMNYFIDLVQEKRENMNSVQHAEEILSLVLNNSKTGDCES